MRLVFVSNELLSVVVSFCQTPDNGYIFDPSDFRRLRLHEAIFKGFDGESVIGPAKIFLKPYWKERGISYFEEEG